MTTLIERMAKAIEPRAFRLNQELYEYCIEKGDSVDESKSCADAFHPLDDAKAKARAALEAMVEPTPPMLIDAGYMRGADIESPELDEDHKEWWRSMISAALNEEQGT